MTNLCNDELKMCSDELKMCSDEFLHFSVWNTPNTTDYTAETNEYKLSSRIKWDNGIELRVDLN